MAQVSESNASEVKVDGSIFPGYYVGCIAGPSLAGVINTKIGWKYCFYINGLLAMVITILWLFCVTDTPQECKALSSDELQFISGNIESTNGGDRILTFPVEKNKSGKYEITL